MKVELELSAGTVHDNNISAVGVEITPELNTHLRTLIRQYGEVRITAVTLITPDTEPYIEIKQ